jgi:hypothetical protein
LPGPAAGLPQGQTGPQTVCQFMLERPAGLDVKGLADHLGDTLISGSSGNSTRSRPAICSGEYFLARSFSTFARSTALVCSIAGFGRAARR